MDAATGIGIAIPVVTALLSWLYLNVFRNIVTYDSSSVQFPDKSARYNPTDNPLGLIVFESVVIKNRSIKSLQNVRIKLDHVRDIFFGRLHGSSIGDLSPPLEVNGEAVIVVDELPAREEIKVAFLHRGVGHLGRRHIKSGGNKYRLVDQRDYRSLVLKAQVIVIVSAMIAVNVVFKA